MRAIWTGEIAFGLVTIPAKLYTATRDLTPHFTTLHKECGSKIQMVRRCPACRRDVEWGELGKGYEVSKGTYALFSKEELDKLEADEPGGAIEIVEFVEQEAVDLAYIEKTYWVGAGGKSSRGFALLGQALLESKRVALAKTRLRTRTRLALLRPHGKLFALDMMRYADEIVSPTEIDVPDAKSATPRELELALGLVKALSGPFDPAKHPDSYRAAVEAAVEEKAALSALAKAPDVTADESTTQEGKVIDLAELLARSLKKAERARGGAWPRAEEGAREGVEEARGGVEAAYALGAARRGMTRTWTPPFGRSVTSGSGSTSRDGSASSKRNRRASVARTRCPSMSANWLPMQTREPPPNGMYARGGSAFSRSGTKRSGSNASGLANASGRRWMPDTLMSAICPLLSVAPMTETSYRALRPIMYAGG
jgi:DNA end-binding protein Ku